MTHRTSNMHPHLRPRARLLAREARKPPRASDLILCLTLALIVAAALASLLLPSFAATSPIAAL